MIKSTNVVLSKLNACVGGRVGPEVSQWDFPDTDGAEGRPEPSYWSPLNPQHAGKTCRDFECKSTKISETG